MTNWQQLGWEAAEFAWNRGLGWMKPLSPTEQSILDKAKQILQELTAEERAALADGWIGVRINIQQGTLKGKPRRWTEVSRP